MFIQSVTARVQEQSHLPLSEIAAPLSFSAEHHPGQSSASALCPERSSCRCIAEAPAGWRAQGTPGLDPAPDPGSGRPWQPTDPLGDAQTDPEAKEPRPCSPVLNLYSAPYFPIGSEV